MNNDSNLERFIRQHRDAFDSENPSAALWEKVEQTLPVRKKPRVFSRNELIRWTAAAAILVALLTSIYFLYIKNSHEQQKPVVHQEPQDPARRETDVTSGIRPDYAVQLQKVSASVEARQELLKAAAAHLPALYQQFEKDLDVLDSAFRALKNQVPQTPNQDVLIRAMIQNLQLQSELLERQLQVIQEFNNTKKVNHEKTI